MKKFTQKDKQKRGTDFESEFRRSCNHYICEVEKMINGGYGTPYDYLLTVIGGAIALELKRILNDKLPYSAITDNERKGLTKFERKVKTNKSFILCNIHNETENTCWLIPWGEVKDAVCSGARGSLDVKQYRSLSRVKFDKGSGFSLYTLETLFGGRNEHNNRK